MLIICFFSVRFPLVSSRSSSNEMSKQDLLHPDEKLLEEFYVTAISTVTNMVCLYLCVDLTSLSSFLQCVFVCQVCAEVQRRDDDEGDEEKHQMMDTQRANAQSQASNSAKDRKKAVKQKGKPLSLALSLFTHASVFVLFQELLHLMSPVLSPQRRRTPRR